MKPHDPIRLVIEGRPRSTKNSREVIRVRGRTRSVMNPVAAFWLATARLSVHRQWRGRPLQHPVHVHIHLIFSSRRSLPDGDNMVNAVFDALKGIALKDDNLACIPSHSFSHELMPSGSERVEITLSLPEDAR